LNAFFVIVKLGKYKNRALPLRVNVQTAPSIFDFSERATKLEEKQRIRVE